MIGIGHIGVGAMARARAGTFLARPDVRMVIGWSRGEQNLAEYERLTGGQRTPDWHAIIDHPGVQAVCVATPTSTHVGFTLAALSAGKHVLVECPATGSLREFDQMAEAAERNGVVFYAGSNYRLDPAARALARAIPRLGRILLARADSSWLPKERPWYFDRSLTGGLFPCVHLYQFTLFYPLGPARSVSAAFGTDSTFGVATVCYESGALGVATGGYQLHGTNDLLAVGTEGILSQRPEGYAVTRGPQIEPIPVEPVDRTAEDNATFLRCIRGEEDWREHARREHALHALAIAAQQSAESGQPIIL